MKGLAFALLCIIFSNSSIAQFNDSTFYYFSLNANRSVTKTTDGTTYLLNNGLKFSIKKKSVVLNSNNTWVYGAQQNKLVNNDFNSSLDFNIYKTLPHFYYWGLASYTSSYSLKIYNQAQVGAGIAYNIVDKPGFLLNVSEGILHERSDLNLGDTARDIYNTFRNSLRLRIRLKVNTIISFNTNNFLQNSLNYGDDYIIRSSSTLSFKMKKWLSLNTGLDYNKVSRTQKENLLFTYGLLVENYF